MRSHSITGVCVYVCVHMDSVMNESRRREEGARESESERERARTEHNIMLRVAHLTTLKPAPDSPDSNT